MKGKKGSAYDLIYISVGILFIAIVAVCVSMIVSKLNTNVQSMDIFPAEAKTASTQMNDGFTNTIDGGIVFLFFGLCIVSFILAFSVYIHPVFFVIFILEWLLTIWIGGAISNVYQYMIENAVITAELSGKYTLTTAFFKYFPLVVGTIGIFLAWAMYKARNQ